MNTSVNIKVGVFRLANNELKMLVSEGQLREYEDKFNTIYLPSIRDVIDNENWGIWFRLIDEKPTLFVVDIYVNAEREYLLISEIIMKNRPKGIEIDIMTTYWKYFIFAGIIQ